MSLLPRRAAAVPVRRDRARAASGGEPGNAERAAGRSRSVPCSAARRTRTTACGIAGRYEALAKEHAVRIAEKAAGERELGLRSESTYLNIIGGLLTLLLG